MDDLKYALGSLLGLVLGSALTFFALWLMEKGFI